MCGFSQPCSHVHITGGLLHWSFVWRLRRHEEGLDWPYRNKAPSGGGGAQGTDSGYQQQTLMFGGHSEPDRMGAGAHLGRIIQNRREKRGSSLEDSQPPQLLLRPAQVTSCDCH
ncbi:hypothetical protein ILYODFUR_020121 [Ilyodon furcidens]|uniref:Uncharacterized protein n=1 Tax=Ilyodon furcidens TaxID=33524 RepID=A0ABV0TK32_9TELE